MSGINPTIPLVTLTTDWGQYDYYLGMLKGRLLVVQPGIRLVDLSHDIPSYNLHYAAFVLRHSFRYFPEGSIHLMLVNSEASLKPRLLIFKYQEHYFITPDNGIIGLLFSTMPDEVYHIPYTPSGGFATLDAYAMAVDMICTGDLSALADSKINDFDKKIALRATIDESIINGSIIYIDSYRNAITNISKNLFERVGQGRSFNIYVQSNHNKISKLCTNYLQVDPGELLALFNSANLLEIAIRNGYASEILSLRVGGSVRVNFKK